MTLRRSTLLFVLVLLAPPGTVSAASFSTPNFTVTAPTEELARRFGEMAEHYRKEKAVEWLGREMPTWSEPCPLEVKLTAGGAGGATTFTFGRGANGRSTVTSRHMEIFGPQRQLLDSVLPHEVTHTVLAHHFGRPVPRWADEGGSVLSENDKERLEHDIRCREILNAGRGIRLGVLFRMTEYPRDMIVLYAQGYSVCAYLVGKAGGGQHGRAELLRFLAYGMRGNDPRAHGTIESWNAAAREVYGVDTIDALEAEWIQSLKTPPSRVAARNAGDTRPRADAAPGLTGQPVAAQVRSSAAPALPVLEPPVRAARGTAPDHEPVGAAYPVGTNADTTQILPDRPPPVLLPPEIPRPIRQ